MLRWGFAVLLVLAGLDARGQAPDAATGPAIDHTFNGTWYQPDLAGHGVNLTVEVTAAGEQQVFLTFFTYDDDGLANFYVGNVAVSEWTLNEPLSIPLQQTAGGGFSVATPLDFSDPAQFADAGSLTLTLFGCAAGAIDYQLAERRSGGLVEDGYAIQKLLGAPLAECRDRMPTGSQTRVARFDDLDSSTYRYLLHVPSGYQPDQPVPLVVAWHGAAGPGQAESQARGLRDLWAPLAESETFIVLCQVGTSPNGSWIPSNAAQILDRLLQQVGTDYAVDGARLYGWGFSAGGHTMHAVALANTHRFAGYAVNAGALNAVVGRDALNELPRRIPFSSLIGTADPLLEQAQGDRDAFQDAGWQPGQELYYREFNGGHSVSANHLSEHWFNLSRHQLPEAD